MTHNFERDEHPGTVPLDRRHKALRQRSEFRGPIDPIDDHDHANDHFALLYESRDEQFAAVIPFIREGLEQGERCLYVADENSRKEILDALHDAGVDVDDALESGALDIQTVHETYLKNGTFDLDESLALLENALQEGVADFEGLRVTVEETWLLREDSATEDFMALEARVNELFRDEDCIALCQYNRERFPPDVIRDVISTHPHLVHESTINQNVYYIPPEEFLGSEQPANEVDRKLGTLHHQTETKHEHQRVVEALEAAREGISLLDADGKFIFVNDAYVETFGYEPEEMIGEHWDALGIEADPEYVYDEVLPAIEREGQWTGTTTCVRNDDSTFLAQHSLTQTEDEELICVIRDVTEQKERERELQRMRTRFEAVFEHSRDAIFINDPYQDEIIDANPAGLDMLGYDREELLSLGPSDCHPDEMEQFRAFVDGVFEDGHGWTDELSCRTKDGEDIPAEISASTIELDDRELMLAIVRDITERKKHERYQRELYEITADTDLSFDEKLEQLLDLGRKRFNLNMGFFLEKQGDEFRVVKTRGTDLEEGVATLSAHPDQYCKKTLTLEGPCGVADTAAAGWDDDPLYTEYDLRCYLGTKVTKGTDTYGTVCFTDSSPREREFTDAEYTFLELMGQWISYELEREHREAQLAGLNEMSRDLMNVETPSDIATATVDHAYENLHLPVAAVVSYDTQTGRLSPAAQTPRAKAELPLTALCEQKSGPLWEAFVANDVRTVEDVPTTAGASNDLTEIIAAPLGKKGLFVTATSASTGFSDAEHEFVETAVATVKAAYSRADREQQLHNREQTLEEQNRALERLNRINTTIRNIDQALVQAWTREEIETAVCEYLANVGPYELAWVGKHDPVSDEIVPEEWAGAEKGYLTEITVTANEESTGRGPGGRAVKTREPQVNNNILTDDSFEPWRQAALNRGYHAAIALPLVYDDTLYGVLGVYAGEPDVFDELEREVLTELADTIAYAINAVESKKSLVSDSVTELEFEVRDTNHPLVAVTDATDCEIELESLVPQSDGGLHAFISTQGVPADEVIAAHGPDVAADLTLISEQEGGAGPAYVFDVVLDADSISRTALEHGGVVQHIRANDGVARFTIELASDVETRKFVETLRTKYPDTELVAHRTRERSPQTRLGFYDRLLDSLTDRQLQVLQTAYAGGYFEEPRTGTAGELADTMDITQPTFTSHLRTAHRKLCQELFEDNTVLAATSHRGKASG